jgi:hypothetical protein
MQSRARCRTRPPPLAGRAAAAAAPARAAAPTAREREQEQSAHEDACFRAVALSPCLFSQVLLPAVREDARQRLRRLAAPRVTHSARKRISIVR